MALPLFVNHFGFNVNANYSTCEESVGAQSCRSINQAGFESYCNGAPWKPEKGKTSLTPFYLWSHTASRTSSQDGSWLESKWLDSGSAWVATAVHNDSLVESQVVARDLHSEHIPVSPRYCTTIPLSPLWIKKVLNAILRWSQAGRVGPAQGPP